MTNIQPLVQRHELRLAVISGLAAGFGLLSPLNYGYYLPVTVVAVLAGSYGTSLKLGIERLIGSLIGWLLLLMFSQNMHLPLPIGMGMALASIRLLGGALGLKVGYKVGGNIIVMGWLLHNNNELIWGPMRLFWTALGIMLSLFAVRWIWPSQAIPALHKCLSDLFNTIAENLSFQAALYRDEDLEFTADLRRKRRQILLAKLQKIRQMRRDAQLELGLNPEDHPLHNLWCKLELLSSNLISSIDGLRALPSSTDHSEPIKNLLSDQADLLNNSSLLINDLSKQLKMPQLLSTQIISQRVLQESTGLIKQALTTFEQKLDLLDNITVNQQISRNLRLISMRALLVHQIASLSLEFESSLDTSTPVTQTS